MRGLWRAAYAVLFVAACVKAHDDSDDVNIKSQIQGFLDGQRASFTMDEQRVLSSLVASRDARLVKCFKQNMALSDDVRTKEMKLLVEGIKGPTDPAAELVTAGVSARLVYVEFGRWRC